MNPNYRDKSYSNFTRDLRIDILAPFDAFRKSQQLDRFPFHATDVIKLLWKAGGKKSRHLLFSNLSLRGWINDIGDWLIGQYTVALGIAERKPYKPREWMKHFRRW